MKPIVYTALVLLVVPFQIVMSDRISIAGIHPDLALIAVCLIGLYQGEMEALLAGFALGLTQDLFSGGAHWGNLCLKPIIGLIAGLASRNLVSLTWVFALGLLFTLSAFSGTIMYLLKSLTGSSVTFFEAALGIILPQACYDALLGFALLKLFHLRRPQRAALTAFTYE
jgi:rod shape-determining protein MreD